MAASDQRARTRLLADIAAGETVRIREVELPAETAAWLAAVGLSPGEDVTLLRRAILGGPLHLRLARGGELAVARDLGTRITIEDI